MDAIQQEAPLVTINIRPSSISTLNEDVLWQIFLSNANMDNDEGFRVYSQDRIDDRQNRALFLTWASSQVCRQWRNIILNSPALWGRLIDLDGLSTAGAAFRDEVMHRSGSSILWIYGKVFPQEDSERDFFASTLARNWGRVGRLRVTIQQWRLIPAYAWKFLFEPAPHLQILSLRTTDGLVLPVLEGKDTNLFNNEAPLLQKFVSWRVNFKFAKLLPGWMASIRTLDVSYMTSTSMAQWLEMLEQIPQIERLILIKPFPSVTDVTQKFCSVMLPKLQGIFIIHELTTCVIFLNHIHPGAGCYLQLNTPDDMDGPLSPATITMAKRVLARYSTNWFNSHPITSFFLSISHREIKISENDFFRSTSYEKIFSLQINCQTIQDLPTLFSLLDIFASCKLERITTLQFEVNIFPEQSLTSEVYRFLLTMPSVETLKFWQPTTIPTLLSLAQSPNVDNETNNSAQTPFFPLLGTIHIETRRGFDDQDSLDSLQKPIFHFLSWRESIGHPVGLLDITSFEHSVRINILDGLSGLKILYQDEEGIQKTHVCRASS